MIIFNDASRFINPKEKGWKYRAQQLMTHLFKDNISAGRLHVFHRLLKTMEKDYCISYEKENVEEFCFMLLYIVMKKNYETAVRIRVGDVISRAMNVMAYFLI